MAKTKRDTLEISKQKKKRQQKQKMECSSSSCDCHKDMKESLRLPPISSLFTPPFYSAYLFDTKYLVKKPPVMPIIPYFYHHKQFGIESCMLQLMENEKTAVLYDC